MDVEKLRKINQLSKELKKHGMAMENAIEQASESTQEKEVNEFLKKSKEEMQSTKNPSSTEQYILMLERNNRKIMEEVQTVKKEVTKIMSEFTDIKKQLEKKPAVKEQSEINEKPKQKTKEKQSQLKSKKKNEKQGEINPEDVSIEKMFYFGKK
ncbi:hypothetical protein GF358_03025 [Candidatus Woesearchaeota archaeon]|nr:hypothetical protein [Candidatus Woesearchaeota archaeon]